MANKNRTANIIRWIARIWGSISMLFLLFMFGAHIIGSLSGEGEGEGFGFGSTIDNITFLFFPFSTVLGLALAWKWEGLGGLITVLGMIGFHFIRPDLIFDPMIDGLAFPGLLFVIYWIMTRKSS